MPPNSALPTAPRARRAAGLGTGVLLGAIAVLAFAGASGADEARARAYGSHLAQECTGCHRIDGVDNGIPSIIGWMPEVFVTTVKFYQDGKRNNPVMVSVANSLNEKQLDALAAYFGSLPKPKSKDKKARR
jgi:cytochrome c